jgi:hypothetical protein
MNEFISNFEAACAKLGRSTVIPDVSAWDTKQQGRLIAGHTLDVILEANNDGWVGDLADTDQEKWFPVFNVVKDEDAPGGFRLSVRDSGYVGDCSSLGVRHACATEELADFMGKECADLYKALHS